MPKYKDLTGQKFGRLTVVEYIGVKYDCANWKCTCRCGKETTATIADLRRASRPKTSCGKCYADHRWPQEWLAWRNAQTRCYNENSKDYQNYGGRGIKMCFEWRHDFFNFLDDMGIKPSPEHTLDRIDNEKDYGPDNCRWADRWTQCHNRRNSNPLFKV